MPALGVLALRQATQRLPTDPRTRHSEQAGEPQRVQWRPAGRSRCTVQFEPAVLRDCDGGGGGNSLIAEEQLLVAELSHFRVRLVASFLDRHLCRTIAASLC
ncbi:MAG: hypothetical protein O3A61_02070 [Actinomycetota bacterium]|nr:hypothetical protein [Actinomycetota bacterium]